MNNFSLIVSQSLLAFLEESVPDLRTQITSFHEGEEILRYPDGSLLLEGSEKIERFYEIFQRYSLGYLSQHVIFRTLAAFPSQTYGISYPKTYYETLMPTPFVAGNFIGDPAKPSEYNLENLALTVRFHRRPKRKIMEKYAGIVQDWYESVRDQGMFGEGPITRISPEVEFEGLRAQFCVDARLSGQKTLNWFILKGLDFGIKVFAIDRIAIADEEFMEVWFGPSQGKTTKIPIATKVVSAEVASARAEESSWPEELPPDCVPYTVYCSRLRLLTRPILEWDAFHVTVYFTELPTADQRRAFEEMIKAWGTMGYYGGFGGLGIHRLRDVSFDEVTVSASFSADMGDAQDSVALPLLISILEGFDGVLPIEAVVFGK